MEPASRQPNSHHLTRPHSRRERLCSRWRSWTPFLPPLVYIIGIVLHIRLNSVLGMVAFLIAYTYYGVLLFPLAWSAVKAHPSGLRLRVMRRILAASAMAIVAIVCLAISSVISGQTNGTVQTILAVIVFVGFGIVFLAMCMALLDASKNVIERYQSDHPGS